MAGKRLRREAADLLACLASQRPSRVIGVAGEFDPFSLPGNWSRRARAIAEDASFWRDTQLSWREVYAEAEARLREATHAR